MAAMRGVRILSSLSCKSVQMGRLHQRRVAYLALPALLQCNSKLTSRFNVATSLPVNKFDLKGGGILTTTSSALFSSESFEVLSDDTLNEVEDEDSQSGIERKWPSPMSQVAKKQENSVFVGGRGLDLDKLMSIFSQFGEVDGVRIPLKTVYDLDPGNMEAYRYAFVDFADVASLKKALAVGTVTTDDDKVIEIKGRTKSRREIENENTFIVNELPIDVTVNDLNEYFQAFGKVLVVNLVLNSMRSGAYHQNPLKEGPRNFAFVVFDSFSKATTLPEVEHSLCGKSIIVSKVNKKTKQQRRDRCCKVLVEGVPDELTEDKIQTFFNAIAPVRRVSVLHDKETGDRTSLAVIDFEDKESAVLASQRDSYNLDGHDLKFRCLGLVNE